jgi:tRNA pseudouridine55 synthase
MTSGIINLNKPVGPSSFTVVRQVRRLTGVNPIGHGGTLDPAAEGVLPILLGRATRLADFVHEWPKTYLATVRMGEVSETYDREGSITPVGDPSGLRAEEIEAVLPRFTGSIMQVPPMHSAIKRGGESLYRKARRGEVVEREARPVWIDQLALLDWDPQRALAVLRMVSGKGMYVRSLVHDLGTALGCGAYLAALSRTAFGPLTVENATTLAQLESEPTAWRASLLPMDLPLRQWPALTLTPSRARAVSQGQSIPVPEAGESGRYRVMDSDGRLLAWGTVDASRRLQPRAVFSP